MLVRICKGKNHAIWRVGTGMNTEVIDEVAAALSKESICVLDDKPFTMVPDCLLRVINNVVKFNKYKNKLPIDFIAQELKKCGLNQNIAEKIFRAGKTIGDLIAQVYHHVTHRSLTKTFSELHALNAAKTILKASTWKTPKRLVWERPKPSYSARTTSPIWHNQELFELRNFMHNIIQGETYG